MDGEVEYITFFPSAEATGLAKEGRRGVRKPRQACLDAESGGKSIWVGDAVQDVWHNYFAGFFLFAAQPFRPGDTLALTCDSDIGPPPVPSQPHTQLGSGWFEGVCESVDLRYTVLRNGRYRLMVPNLRFVQKEFLVLDSEGLVKPPNGPRSTRRKKEGGKGVVVGGE